MPIRVGLEGSLRRGTVGTAMGTLTAVNNVRDLTLSMEKGEADTSTRAAGGWRTTLGTLKSATLEFNMNFDVTDADVDAFQVAFMSNTIIALAVLDAASGEGLIADWTVTGFSIEQPLEDTQTVSVTCKPAYVSRNPAWHTPT
jgi:predicted secreted protein